MSTGPVISDSHSALVAAIRKPIPGAARQCRRARLRRGDPRDPQGIREMVAAAIRAVFIQPAAEAVHHQLDAVADIRGRQFPELGWMLPDAMEGLTAALPSSHGEKRRYARRLNAFPAATCSKAA